MNHILLVNSSFYHIRKGENNINQIKNLISVNNNIKALYVYF